MTAKVSPKIRDTQGMTADQVCYSPAIRKQLQPRYVQSRDMAKDKVLMKPSLQDKDSIFKLATSPQQFTDLQKKLQTLDFNVNTECDNNGDFLLHIACRSGLNQLPLLMALVKIQGADIELCNVDGMTPLMLSATVGNCVLCDVLICLFGANPNKTNTLSGRSALHYAAEGNHRKTVECVIRRGADVNLEDHDGLRPDDMLGYVSTSDDCCEIIIFNRSKRLEMLSDLVKKGQVAASQLFTSDLYVVDPDGYTLIMMAATYNRVDTLEALLSISKSTINAQHSRTGVTALGIAAQKGNTDAVNMLLRHGANPTIADMKGFLPLHYAVVSNHEATVDTILRYFPETYVGLYEACRMSKRTSIHDKLSLACGKRQEEIVNPKLLACSLNGDAEELFQLLDEGDNINPKSGSGNWPLYLAVENGNLDVVKLIFEKGGDYCKRHPTTGATILHVAAKMGHQAIVAYLLQYCDSNDLKKKTQNPKPVPIIAVSKTQTHVASSPAQAHLYVFNSPTLNHGKVKVSSDGSKWSPHHSAAANKMVAKKKMLDVDAVDRDNKTSLQMASERGFSAIVEMLLEHGSTTSILGSDGKLFSANQYDGVRTIIEMHRKLHIKEIVGCILDKSRKSLTLLHQVWRPKFDHYLRTKEGHTPLMVAALSGRIPALKLMLQSAVYANIDQVEEGNNQDSDTDSGVLEFSRGPRDWRNVKDKFNMSQSLDIADVPHELKMDLPLPKASEGENQSLTSSMELFNRRRFHQIIQDANRPKEMSIYHSGMVNHVCAVSLSDGTSALHQAVLGGDIPQILSTILEVDAGAINMQDDAGETVLHLSCRLNRKKCIEVLLARPEIDPNVRTLTGLLPEELTRQKSIRKMVEKARGTSVIVEPDRGTLATLKSPSSSRESEASHSTTASTINFDKVHNRYEEMKHENG